MTTEYTPRSFELQTRRSSRAEQKMAEYALFDGFTPLEEAKSPTETIKRALEAKIIEQPAAIEAITEALDRSRIRLRGDSRPIATLAFLGPTGVGKSETAKMLSEFIADGDDANLIKIDCSDYSHGHEITKLTGSPPSYVGYGQDPLLSSDNIKQPGTVILFDEIEKGSPELYHLMLQITGDGELKLNNGDVTSFRDTIIILTSNLGAKEMSRELGEAPVGFGIASGQRRERPQLEKIASESFKKHFTPEFVNRLNKLIIFHPLSSEGLGKILDIKLADANTEYEEEHGVHVSLTEKTRDHLVGIAAQEPQYGARPLVRALEDNVQSELGRYIGSGQVPEGTHIRVFHKSEAQDEYVRRSENPLIFAAREDLSIKKKVIPSTTINDPHFLVAEDAEAQKRGTFGQPLDPED